MAIDIKGIGSFWKRVEPGYKIITAAVVLLTMLASTISWAYATNGKLQKIDRLESYFSQMSDSIQRQERNQARMAAKFGIYIEPPPAFPRSFPDGAYSQ